MIGLFVAIGYIFALGIGFLALILMYFIATHGGLDLGPLDKKDRGWFIVLCVAVGSYWVLILKYSPYSLTINY